jgi:hypothetical protein
VGDELDSSTAKSEYLAGQPASVVHWYLMKGFLHEDESGRCVTGFTVLDVVA